MSDNGNRSDLRSDVLSTIGLMLNIGAVISMALWFGMAGSHSGSGLRAIPGTLTILLFAASIVCFAVDRDIPDSELPLGGMTS